MKTCIKCKQTKDLENFSKKSSNKDGLNFWCRECCKTYSKNYIKNNSEKIALKKKEWAIANKEKKLKANKEHYQNNKNRYKYLNNKWKSENRDRYNYLQTKVMRKRQILHKNAIPKWFEEEKVSYLYLKAKQFNMQVDHIVPLNSPIVCGLHCWHNLQLLDISLNSSKSNKTWVDMP